MSNYLAQGQERFRNPLSGYTPDQSVGTLDYQTGQNVNGQKRAADIVLYGTYSLSTLNAIEAGSTQRIIKKTAHGARKNDVVQFTSGLASGVAIQILSVPDANTMILAATPEFTLAVADTFDIKRYVSPQYAADGSLNVTTSVNLGTAITGSVMPAGGVSNLGWLSAIYTKLIGIISVTEAPSVPTYDESSVIDGTTVVTLTAPANAKGCKVITPTSNSGSIPLQVTLDGVTAPSSTVGMEFQAGRSEDFIGVKDLKVIAKSAITAQKLSVHWYV